MNIYSSPLYFHQILCVFLDLIIFFEFMRIYSAGTILALMKMEVTTPLVVVNLYLMQIRYSESFFTSRRIRSMIRFGMATRSQLVTWIEKSIEKENLKEFVVKIIGGSEKDQGYIGDIVFVEVDGTTEDNVDMSLHMVVKHAKNNPLLKNIVPIGDMFSAEIHIYSRVFPVFMKFQQQRNITNSFDFTPKLFYSTSYDDMEVLILENLKMEGFEHHDRLKPMNVAHSESVLEQYGKFHAVSLAMRAQDPDTFNNLISKLGDPYMTFYKASNVGGIYKHSFAIAREMLEKNGDRELLVKLDSLLREGCDKIIRRMVEKMKVDPQSVIVHGDCWCDNYLFKYKNSDTKIPSRVAILDWQLSSLRSPVFDLSSFIYSVCSKTELMSFEELLRTYYNSLATHLTDLGNDPKELFSYEDLKRHWKEYSAFGFIHVTAALRLLLCDKDKDPDGNNKRESTDAADFLNGQSFGGGTVFYSRLKDIVSHYFEYLDKLTFC